MPHRFTLIALVCLAAGARAEGADYLRPGTSSKSAAPSTGVSASGTVPTVQSIPQAQQELARTTAALQAMQTLQAQARAAAQAATGTVANGLTVGGLVPTGSTLATGSTTVELIPAQIVNNTSSQIAVNKGGTVNLPSGTGVDDVTISGSGTVTTGNTTTPFSGSVTEALPANSSITWTGSGSVGYASGAATSIAATVPSSNANFSSSGIGVSNWTGIGGLAQATTSPAVTVTIDQTQQQALLNWSSFNVGANTTLAFDQSTGGSNVANWVAINQISNQMSPSQILGNLTAPGQVYVINQNGIIFGGTAQINTGALVVSSLPINSNLVADGFLNNPDYQFLFSQQNIAAGTQGPTPAFTPAAAPTGASGGVVAHVDSSGNVTLAAASGHDGDVVVEAGAQLTSPASSQNVGGKIALVGPNVSNAGAISTADGQTILAAGLQVGFVAHNSNDPSLRGLDTYVGAVDAASGTVSNRGLIGTLDGTGAVAATPGADVTLTGATVQQLGDIDLATTTTLNSRVDLLADYGAKAYFHGSAGFNGSTGLYPTLSGTVTLGSGSVTALLPDTASASTVVGTQLALPSIVDIQGQNITLDLNALLWAPDASLPSNTSQPALGIAGTTLTAGVTLNAGTWNFANATELFTNSAGTVALDQGAAIDVSGSQDVAASVAEDVVTAQLLGTELADSPLQQESALRGQTVYVDLLQTGVYDGTAWVGTPLADVSGYVNLVERSVGELTDAGGTVAINAGAAVDLNAGSTINVSGGWINYQGATVPTTNLVLADGQIINIAQATPTVVYNGLYNGFTVLQSKYGLSQTYENPLINGTQYLSGFIQGGAGGSLSITAPSVALAGSLEGNTAAGANQRTAASAFNGSTSAYASASFLPTALATLSVPKSSSLSLAFYGQTAADQDVNPTTPQNVDFGSTALASGDIVLPTTLASAGGFGSFTIYDPLASVTLPAGDPLALGVGGALTVTAANVDIESAITAPGGSLAFTVLESAANTGNGIDPPTGSSPAGAVSAYGNFTLGAAGALETGGLLVSDLAGSPTADTLPLFTTGGNVSIAGYSVFLRPGGKIDVSGGASIGETGTISYGSAGSISILAGQDPTETYTLGGLLDLGSTLSAYSGTVGGGGKLTIAAPLVQIGGALGTGLQNGDTGGVPTLEQGSVYGNGTTLWLDPSGTGDFFSEGGFGSFSIDGLGMIASSGFLPGVFIAPGTALDPSAEGEFVAADDALLPVSPGAAAALLDSQRTSVSLSFDALGVQNNPALPVPLLIRGDLVMSQGSSIATGPGATVALAAQGTATVLGSVIAPGGTISVKASGNSTGLLFADITEPLTTVLLGPDSLLSTAGTVERTANAYGYTTGSVLSGGKITISGNIVAEAGAVLDVSGASGSLDVMPAQAGLSTTNPLYSAIEVPTEEASNAGSITLSGGQKLLSDATLIGLAGGPSAEGGSLTLSSSLFSTSPLAVDPSLVITQGGPVLATGQTLGVGLAAAPANPVFSAGGEAEGYFAAASNIFGNTAVSNGGNGGVAGGFQALALEGSVEFSGPVAITAGRSISVAQNSQGALIGIGNGGVIDATGAVVLSAPDVTLGLNYQGPLTALEEQEQQIFGAPVNPTTGAGSLTINATTLADVGNLSLQNIGALNFNTTLAGVAAAVKSGNPVTVTGAGTIVASTGGTIATPGGTTTTLVAGVATTVAAGNVITLSGNGTLTPAAAGIIPAETAGDIRGDGTLDVAGTIAMTAGQVYAPTETTFSIFAYDFNNLTGNGLVAFAQPLTGTLPPLPLSAGSTLNVYASTIVQGGVLRAPDGTIDLGVGAASATPVDYLTGSGTLDGNSAALPVPATGTVTLTPGSITSVSQIDPSTGNALTIPYGIVNASGDWIDPAGNDITSAGNGVGGLPAKSISISGQTVADEAGATIDLRGGGDLYAYEFVTGTGGTNDLLASTTGFAVLPSSAVGAYAPYAPYASSTSLETNGVADAGYANSALALGSQIYLGAGSGLAAGVYTLLPARYALLPGAYLVTPLTGTALAGAQAEPTGAVDVSGYRFNGLSNSTAAAPLYTEFQVESQALVRAQADYQNSYANTFFPAIAASDNLSVPRLPQDAGQLVLSASEGLTVLGSLESQVVPGSGGLGSEVDISSADNIEINDSGVDASFTGLVLDSTQLTDFGAESLLIGGYRTAGFATTSLTGTGSAVVVPATGGSLTFPSGTPGNDTIAVSGTGTVGSYTTPSGTTTSITGGTAITLPTGSVVTLSSGGTVTFHGGTGGAIPVKVAVAGTGVSVTTGQVTLNNVGETLSGPDIILVSNAGLTVEAGSGLAGVGTSTAPNLSLIGNGTVVRVAGDSTASITRASVHASTQTDPANLQIQSTAGNVTTISGGAVILDSTNATTLASGASLSGTAVALDSGQISLELTTPLTAPTTTGLILSGAALANLQAKAQSLSLLSYSSIDIYNDNLATPGVIGGAAVNGVYPVSSLSLRASDLRGFDGGDVVIAAQTVSLGNSAGGAPLGGSGSAGTLSIDAQTIQLGSNILAIDDYANVNLNATQELLLAGLGAQSGTDTVSSGSSVLAITPATLAVTGNLLIHTPVISGATGLTASSAGTTSYVDEAITAQGLLTVTSSGPPSSSLNTSGLGAKLQLTGASVDVAGTVVLHSGAITAQAASGNVTVDAAGTLDVSGLSPSIYSLTKFTDGGSVTLNSATGNVTLAGLIDVAAASGVGTTDSQAGNAGSVTISAPLGSFTTGGAIDGAAGVVTSSAGAVLAAGAGGTFSLDEGTLPGGNLAALEALLNPAATGSVAGDDYVGGFTDAQTIRVRNGSIVVAGTVAAETVSLAADNGDIEVTGAGRIAATAPGNGLIDISTTVQTVNGATVTTLTNPGAIGGSVTLAAGVAAPGTLDASSGIAYGSVVLDPLSMISVAGRNFNAASQGGSVTLQAGSDLNGSAPATGTARTGSGAFAASVPVVNIQSGATVDLTVEYLPLELPTSGASTITLASAASVFLPGGTPGNDALTVSSAGNVIAPGGATTAFAAGATLSDLVAGSVISVTSRGATLSFARGGTGGALTVDLPSQASFTSTGATNLSGNAALTAAQQGDLTGTLTLQAPQTASQLDVQVDPINGTILQASSILVAGLYVQNANQTGTVSIDGATSAGGNPGSGAVSGQPGYNYETTAQNNATLFGNNDTAITSSLLGADPQGLAAVLNVRPAEEIDNTAGSLVLNNTWDFSTSNWRFGANGVQPGLLILRAAGNLSIAFGASITDGFDTTDAFGDDYTANLLPSGSLSWSYHLVAGADFKSANLASVVSGNGSFVLGLNSPTLPTTTNDNPESIFTGDEFYQTIRTGTGSIAINAGGNVQILDNLATIYTAGTQVNPQAGFDPPSIPSSDISNGYPAQYSVDGGSVTIAADGNIGHYTKTGTADSSKELPTSWLDRQGYEVNGVFAENIDDDTIIESTSWWSDFSNFFEGVGTLGGGNVSVQAGGSVVNLDAVAATDAYMPGRGTNNQPIAPNAASLVELGGGNVSVVAGLNIDAGVYYVEKGAGTLAAGNDILTNSTRAAVKVSTSATADPFSWLPTTLFVGAAGFDVSADGSLLLGPVANPFLLPQELGNGTNNKSYFSTYATTDAVDVASLSGTVTLQDNSDTTGTLPGDGVLYDWYENIFLDSSTTLGGSSQQWLLTVEPGVSLFDTAFALMPPTLRATSYEGNIDLHGSLTLSPSPTGTIDLLASGSVNAFQPNSEISSVVLWGSSTIDLSDANPASIPGVASPLASPSPVYTVATKASTFTAFNALFAESGATQDLNLQTEESLHADVDGSVLHADDSNPVYIYAGDGSISGLTLYSPKAADVVASEDLTDIGLYLQNDNTGDVSVVQAGRNILAYDSNTPLRIEATSSGNNILGLSTGDPLGNDRGAPNTGDIQISGPGTLEVFAGNNLTLGDGPSNTSGPDGTSNGTDTGITSVGNERNPYLPSTGADIVAAGGVPLSSVGLTVPDSAPEVDFTSFENDFLNPNDATADPNGTESARYLPDLATLMGLPSGDTNQQIWTAFQALPARQQALDALNIYYQVLRDSGRDHNTGTAGYPAATEAVAALFSESTYAGAISLSSREIKTDVGGNIDLLAPGGGVVVGFNLSSQPVDQGVLTVGGGNISIFTNNDVTVGTSRIFTLDGGNVIIYSSNGNIAAGASSKTVQSAPPTRVLVNAQSAAVETDLAGLATGGGIGVLESQSGAQASDVDLIAPKGTVDAGDAGIRVSGNLNIAAVQVLNAGNISVGGKSAGVPTASAPNLGGLAAASSAAGAGANAASDISRQQQQQAQQNQEADVPSLITVDVLGYGGGDAD